MVRLLVWGNCINSPSRKAPSVREPAHSHSHSVCTETRANTLHDHNIMLYIHSAETKQRKIKHEKIGKGQRPSCSSSLVTLLSAHSALLTAHLFLIPPLLPLYSGCEPHSPIATASQTPLSMLSALLLRDHI